MPSTEDRTTTTTDAVPTWNVCPTCGHRWTDRVPTPGVVHRTQLCTTCRQLARAEGAD